MSANKRFDAVVVGASLGGLASAALLILGLKLLGSPATARRGNLLASAGLLSAVGVTLLDRTIHIPFRRTA